MSNSVEPDLVHAHVLIAGEVQGVGYRMTTHKIATHLGLNGWVRNLPDGRVEAVFEGDRATVERIIHWCHQGPPTSLVKSVAVEYNSLKEIKGFQIRR